MANKDTLSQMFILLRANWPRYDFSDHTMMVYEKCLADISDDVLAAATVDCIGRCTFWPKVAEIRSACYRIMNNAIDQPTAHEAWAEVVRLMGIHNAQLRPPTERAIKCLGGMSAIGRSQESELGNWRARFIKTYEVLESRDKARAMTLPAVRLLTKRIESVRLLEDDDKT